MKNYINNLEELKEYLKTNPTNLYFDCDFNQPLDNIKFPESLTNITFDESFNQPLDNVKFPKFLTNITFGDDFNQSLDNVKFPESLKLIIFASLTKRLLNLPISLEKIIVYDDEYNNLAKSKIPFGCEVILDGEAWAP